jgi:hypothetical protein
MKQYLSKVNARHIQELQFELEDAKVSKAYYWSNSVKGTVEGEIAHQSYKHYRNQLSKYCRQLKRAHEIQNLIKEMP